ncbi:MAG TPA: DUF1553 domain-containing protein, partial [Pirellulaceae bacterium]|nr:DUF1553 domain-containing protein [Pirellulaceae bacterium]
PIRLANRTSRAFLGMRIDCLQCHDDRLDKVFLGTPDAPRDGQQQDFHRLAAFFVDTQNSPVGIRDKKQPEGYRYKFLHDEEESKVEPGVPFQDDLAPSDGRLRRQLAAWVTHPENKPFARATVNRFWALVCGRPLVEPIDEVPLHGPFPPGLEALADDFIAHRYDVRRLIRVIASTAAFRHDSRAECDITPEHEKHWAVFPLTRLRPEQVAGGVIQASSLSTIDADAHIVRKLIKFGQTNEFVKRYGDTGEDEFDDRGGTIPQRLLLMNGEMVTERIGENIVFNAATRIAALTQNNERAVEATYLSVLSRRPTEEELKFFVAKLEAARNRDRREAVEDLWWILINSTEFSWNH